MKCLCLTMSYSSIIAILCSGEVGVFLTISGPHAMSGEPGSVSLRDSAGVRYWDVFTSCGDEAGVLLFLELRRRVKELSGA